MLSIDWKKEAMWELASLGEILLRFDPGHDRIHNARSFSIHDGGAEYNVARNLAKVFRRKTVIVTALADNPIGRLAEDFAQQATVDTSQILWRDSSANLRNGLYFIERGFGLRAPDSCFDRSHTAISQLSTGEIDWTKTVGKRGARWFHSGGVFAGLSETSWEVALEAVQIARQNEVIVSYDLNYRDSLWKGRGGKSAANEVNRRILPFVDVVFGTLSEEFTPSFVDFDKEAFHAAAEKMKHDFPNLKVIVSTLRDVHSASRHSFGAACFAENRITVGAGYRDFEVFDRVGSGDAFVSGFIHSLMDGKDEVFAVNCGTALAVLAMTTRGDNSSATLAEIEHLMQGHRAVVKR